MRTVICYCYHISHVLNLGLIPSLLAQKGWKVRWMNAFPASYFPFPEDTRINYVFDVTLAQVGNEEADLYLSPFVGQSSNFPRRATRVHFLVSMTSLEGVYDKAMFDHYEVIACAGRHHIEEFTALAENRGWVGKKILPVGYPKLDGQCRQLETQKLAPLGNPLTVGFAPTHAYYVNIRHSVLGNYGERVIEALIEAGIKVIFRPHMESWRDQDRPVVERIVTRFYLDPLFALDRSSDYFETYAQCDMMLTDISGTGFTYAFVFGRPALFFAPDIASEKGRLGIQFEKRESIGMVIRDISDLLPAVREASLKMEALKSQIANFRDELVFNLGHSEQYFADHAESLIDTPPHRRSLWGHIFGK